MNHSTRWAASWTGTPHTILVNAASRLTNCQPTRECFCPQLATGQGPPVSSQSFTSVRVGALSMTMANVRGCRKLITTDTETAPALSALL
ncbi:hypothetical protein CDEST_04892 [Colletotrichum destructivum]|uniref:Uncharacterized protein n=1 Tax=Colletotrichum destructivum TaxID=34406 RepID=A0AAX4I943_9PEZI|nr:hypothetical protein CDEST_04892 [Colletotrichum destructivum]